MRPVREAAGPAALTALLLCVLLALGVWQLHRRAWKHAILTAIDRAEHAPPVPLGEAVPPRWARVSATGVLRPGDTALYGSDVHDLPSGPVLGAQLIGVLDRPGLRPVLVDIGWVPTRANVTLPSGPVTLNGYARPSDHAGLLSATDDLGARRFYTLDAPTIGAALSAGDVEPFTLIAMGTIPASGFPAPAETLPRPPDNHLQYALTWFGLALALLVVFLVWLGGRERKNVLF